MKKAYFVIFFQKVVLDKAPLIPEPEPLQDHSWCRREIPDFQVFLTNSLVNVLSYNFFLQFSFKRTKEVDRRRQSSVPRRIYTFEAIGAILESKH